MRGDKTIPLPLVLLDSRRQMALLGRRLLELRLARAELGCDLAIADLQVGDSPLVVGARNIELSLQFFGALCYTAFFGRRLLQLCARLGHCLA